MNKDKTYNELKESIDTHYLGYIGRDDVLTYDKYLFRIADKYLYVYAVTTTDIKLSFTTLLDDIVEINSAGIFTTNANYMYV